MSVVFFTYLGAAFTPLLQVIIGVFFQFLLIRQLYLKIFTKISTHPTFELWQDDTGDEGKKTKHSAE